MNYKVWNGMLLLVFGWLITTAQPADTIRFSEKTQIIISEGELLGNYNSICYDHSCDITVIRDKSGDIYRFRDFYDLEMEIPSIRGVDEFPPDSAFDTLKGQRIKYVFPLRFDHELVELYSADEDHLFSSTYRFWGKSYEIQFLVADELEVNEKGDYIATLKDGSTKIFPENCTWLMDIPDIDQWEELQKGRILMLYFIRPVIDNLMWCEYLDEDD